MSSITVERLPTKSDYLFKVVVSDKDGKTTHKVRLVKEYYQKLTNGKIPPEKLIESSFVFLLEREPKAHILPEFDLAIISKYFPEYLKEIKKLI